MNERPSALYATIKSQPEIVRAVVEGMGEEAARVASLLAGARRVVLAGTGTSSHAAIVGEHLLRAAGIDAYATTSFDFAVYPRPLGPGDVLIAISHRGSKRYGVQAIALARRERMRIIGVTGQDSPMDGPEMVLRTAPQETSSAHTASYSANLAALALIAVSAGEQRGAGMREMREALSRLPDAMASLLAHEDAVRSVAKDLAARGRMILVGAGPNAATAREGALKVKESSYLVAEGFELETALHGALQAAERGDVAVVIAAHGPALDRTADLTRALTIIGARLLVIADERVASDVLTASDDNTPATLVTYPAVPEPLSPSLAVIPLQLLAQFTAELRGTNPDSFRADDPIYKQANESYRL